MIVTMMDKDKDKDKDDLRSYGAESRANEKNETDEQVVAKI